MLEKQISRLESKIVPQTIEKQFVDVETKITPEDMVKAHKRVKEEFDKIYRAPTLDSLDDLRSLKDGIVVKKWEVDKLQISWGKALGTYQKTKTNLEALMITMSQKQSDIKNYAGGDSVAAKTLRTEFIAYERKYITMVTELQWYKSIVETLYPTLQKALSGLAEQKKIYADKVIVSRQWQWNKIIQWNNQDLPVATDGQKMTELSNAIDKTTQSTANNIGSTVARRKIYKNLANLEKTEKTNRSAYAEAVFDTAIYDAINFNKVNYQALYLLDLKRTLKADLELAKMSDSDLYKDLASAKVLKKEPAPNQTTLVSTDAEWQKTPVFSYANYKTATLQLEDTVIDQIEKEVGEWNARNTVISDFQTTLVPTGAEIFLESNFSIFETNLQSQTRKYLHDATTPLQSWQKSGRDIIKSEDKLNTLYNEDPILSIKGRLMMYKNTLIKWFNNLNTEHQRLKTFIASSTKLTGTQISNITSMYNDIRDVRNEIRSFGVIGDIGAYPDNIQELIKNDEAKGKIEIKNWFNIGAFIDKLKPITIDLKTVDIGTVPTEKYKWTWLDWKWFATGDGKTFDLLSIGADGLSYKGDVDSSKNYTPFVNMLWEEELDTIDLQFAPVVESMNKTIAKARSIGVAQTTDVKN